MTAEHLSSHQPQQAGRLGVPASHGERDAPAGLTGQTPARSAGATNLVPVEARLALFQLTSALSYPNLQGAGTSHYTVEPTPTATARKVWCHQFDAADHTPAGDPLRSYGGTANSRDETIFHPSVFRNANGYAIGHPAFQSGDRVLCVWNRQSGRWEIISHYESVWRFELKTTLTPGSWATAYLLDASVSGGSGTANTNVEFTVYDAIDGTLCGRAKTETLNGTQGYAKFMADSGRWEIIAMAHRARWIRFSLSGALSYSSSTGSGTVLSYWDGENPDPTGAGVTLVNCATTGGAYLFAGASGNIGLASYDPVNDDYRIVQLQC